MRKPAIRTHKHGRLFRAAAVLLSIAATLMIIYLVVIYSRAAVISYWRGIWIETAMTTGDHQWLATAFFPQQVIEEVMARKTDTSELVGGIEFLNRREEARTPETQAPETSAPETAPGTTTEVTTAETTTGVTTAETAPDPNDILGQAALKVGAADYAGNTVKVNDIGQGIVVSEVVGNGFKGKVMLIDDPSRIFIGETPYKDTEGLRILDMLDYHKAVAGINASGFSDPNGEGNGGEVFGISCSGGSYWGDYASYYGSVALTDSDTLVVGSMSLWNDVTVRDGIQFGPVLMANGEKTVTGSAGYGIQPRTAIGQREDGAIVMVVIDGRNLLHSIGCTVGDLADIFESYGCVNAACCDGGSSSIMAYDGEVITQNCSLNPSVGRRLPNAFLVREK